MYKTKESLLRFMRGMHCFATMSARYERCFLLFASTVGREISALSTLEPSRPFLTAFDLSQFRHAVDLGGATGAIMVQLAELHPTCSCTVVELPHVVDAGEVDSPEEESHQSSMILFPMMKRLLCMCLQLCTISLVLPTLNTRLTAERWQAR